MEGAMEDPKEQWNDAEYARAWAARNAEDTLERRQPLDLLVKMLADFFAASDVPRRVLDLGCGHGVVAARALADLRDVSLVGVDGSAPMLELARERLAPYGDRVTLAQAAFETLTPADLPGSPYGAAFAVQAIHNTDDEGKKRAYAMRARDARPRRSLSARRSRPPCHPRPLRRLPQRLGRARRGIQRATA